MWRSLLETSPARRMLERVSEMDGVGFALPRTGVRSIRRLEHALSFSLSLCSGSGHLSSSSSLNTYTNKMSSHLLSLLLDALTLSYMQYRIQFYTMMKVKNEIQLGASPQLDLDLQRCPKRRNLRKRQSSGYRFPISNRMFSSALNNRRLGSKTSSGGISLASFERHLRIRLRLSAFPKAGRWKWLVILAGDLSCTRTANAFCSSTAAFALCIENG